MGVCPKDRQRMTASSSTNPRAFEPGNRASVGHGAPRGNVNGLRSGVSSEAVRLCKLGALPDRRVTRDVQSFRRKLEMLTVEAHGELRPGHELAINTATRHEIVCRLAVRWLTEAKDKLSPTERLHFVSTMAKHSDLRDKAVERLRLEQSPADVIDSLYGPVLPSPDVTGADADNG